MSDTLPGNRLERALDVFLASAAEDTTDVEGLLAAHPELRDLLEPMFRGAPEGDDGVDADTFGDYRLVRELGRGGMGVVHEAWQRSLGRRVAIKILAPGLVESPAAVARFRREAAAAGRLHHPNIVEVFDVGCDHGRHWFAMRLVDGQPLHLCHARFAAPRAAAQLVATLADALAHAHAAGLVHRDVKPANVLIASDGTPLLTDFGVASDESLPTLTRDGGFVGTLEYASPEQVRGEAVDGRTDVWALGVVLYELLSGVRPFAAETQQATLHAVLSAEPPSLVRVPGVARDLAAIVGKAIEKHRDRRYPSARALADDLRRFLAGQPVTARLPNTVERALAWARREPWRATAAALLAIGIPLLGAGAGYLWANAGRIQAALAAEAIERREDVLARAWDRSLENAPADGVAILDELPDGDVEIAMSRALLLEQAGRRDDALAALPPPGPDGDDADPRVRLLRLHLTDPDAAAELAKAPGQDPFDCVVRAELLTAHAIRHGSSAAASLRRAREQALAAVALARTPQLYTLIAWARAAHSAEDAQLVATVERALARHFPDHPVAVRRRATLLAPRDPAAVLELLPDAARHTDAAADFWMLRGLAHETAREFDAAVAAAERAIAIQPERSGLWSNLSVAQRKRGDHPAAVAAAQRAVELDAVDARAHNLLGLACKAAGDRDGAVAAFTRAIELRPNHGAYHYNLGNVLGDRGELAAACASFSRAVAAEPGNVRYLANLASAMSRDGRDQEALLHHIEAMLAGPREFIPAYNVGSTALELGLAELGLVAARRARDLDPDGGLGLALHARALLAQREPDAARALDEAREADRRLGGRNLEARIGLARALVANGERAAAIEVLEATVGAPQFAKSSRLAVAQELLDELRGS